MDKWLKSPNSTNTGVAELIVEVLVSIGEISIPRIGEMVLSRTPIDAISKTANIS